MLKDELKSLPDSPGVYQYFDKENHLLYVGKAKNLKKRVRSYFAFTPDLHPNPKLSARITNMIKEAVHIEWTIQPSEGDALILENSFIKQLNPKYNILLRDDKTYPYIYMDLSEDFPRPAVTRKIIKGKDIKYFGPFYKGAKEILEAIYELLPLVQKGSCKSAKKACIFYQINRCKAPCENKITSQEYEEISSKAIEFLKNPSSLLPSLKAKMMNLANNENFEEALHYRDMINKIEDIKTSVQIDLAKLEDFEVFSIGLKDDFLCVVRFSIRDGKLAFAKHDLVQSKNADLGEVKALYKQSILKAFPKDKPVASRQIYVYEDFEDLELVKEILNKRFDKKFNLQVPKIGEKLKIAKIAYENSISLIDKHKKTSNYEFLREIKEYFKLQNLPVKIEIFDNSHLFGVAPVGGMVAFDENKFNKANYRKFHLNSNNDYDQMNETLTRRAMDFDKLSAPDLWVLDGGDTLLRLASDIISSSGANVDIMAISKEKLDAKSHRAKGAAKDILYTKYGKFNFSVDDKKLQFFQRLRDEAHRFAITFHKASRHKLEIQSSKLQNLGISEGSIKKLINYYGSFEEIFKAKSEDIAKITNKSVAQKIANSRKN